MVQDTYLLPIRSGDLLQCVQEAPLILRFRKPSENRLLDEDSGRFAKASFCECLLAGGRCLVDRVIEMCDEKMDESSHGKGYFVASRVRLLRSERFWV